MDYSVQELKQIARLRKQEEMWPSMRWVLLAGGMFSIAASCFIAISLINDLASMGEGKIDLHAIVLKHAFVLNQSYLLSFAVFWPQCIFGLCFGAWCLLAAIRDWHGNANRLLLLKLLEAQRQPAVSPASAV